METVCWICGYSEKERRQQGCEPGRCDIPREVGKDARRCLMRAKAALPEFGAGESRR